MDFARKYLSQFDEQFTLFRDKARLLAQRSVKADDAREYIDTLFPPVPEYGRSKSIRDRKVAGVRSAYRNSRQQLPSIKGSWWSLYNAVSESIDHGQRSGRHDRKRCEKHMLSTMDGSGAEMKEKAFRLAVDMVG